MQTINSTTSSTIRLLYVYTTPVTIHKRHGVLSSATGLGGQVASRSSLTPSTYYIRFISPEAHERYATRTAPPATVRYVLNNRRLLMSEVVSSAETRACCQAHTFSIAPPVHTLVLHTYCSQCHLVCLQQILWILTGYEYVQSYSTVPTIREQHVVRFANVFSRNRLSTGGLGIIINTAAEEMTVRTKKTRSPDDFFVSAGMISFASQDPICSSFPGWHCGLSACH